MIELPLTSWIDKNDSVVEDFNNSECKIYYQKILSQQTQAFLFCWLDSCEYDYSIDFGPVNAACDCIIVTFKNKSEAMLFKITFM